MEDTSYFPFYVLLKKLLLFLLLKVVRQTRIREVKFCETCFILKTVLLGIFGQSRYFVLLYDDFLKNKCIASLRKGFRCLEVKT